MKIAESPVYQGTMERALKDRGKREFFEQYLSEKKSDVEKTQEESPSDEKKSPVMEYYGFVMDRIKNGDPKYQIGGQAMSVKEWDRLVEKIDKCIDEIREDQEERQEKLQEKKEQEDKKEEQ